VWQLKPTIPPLLLYNQSLQLHPSFPSLLPTATPFTTKTFSTMAATVAHTIAGIAPGARPTAAQVRDFEASFYAAARSMPSH